jgi:XRE family aerobic/anaerobic benzoate catabolism transcriptional regulator
MQIERALRDANPGTAAPRGDAKLVVRDFGQRLRLARAKRGMTRRQLANASGTSERYLAQIESGHGNASIVILHAIARALDLPMTDLLPGPDARSEPMTRIIDVLTRVPAAELPAIADLIEKHAGGGSDRARRISLVGLRGAGKSTLGRSLARALAMPFIELDRIIEEDYGARLSDLIEIVGVAAFRRQERASLERVIAKRDAAVIATAGGVVSNPETYALLLRRTHSVWIKARPDEHMSRVVQQGDLRPMAQNRQAMADLLAILDARQADYARAHAELDTSGDTVERSCEKLLRIARRCLNGMKS